MTGDHTADIIGFGSAGVYFSRGQIDPFIAAPVAVGVMAGAFAGSRTLGRIDSGSMRMTFVVVLVVIAAQMLLKGAIG